MSSPFQNTPPQVFWPVWVIAMVASIGGALFGILWLEAREASMWAVAGVALSATGIILGLAFMADRRCFAVRGRLSGARRRYMWRLMPSMAAYVALLLVAEIVFDNSDPSGAMGVMLAVAPAAPLIIAIAAMGLYVMEEEDEFQRTIQTQSFVLATMIALAVCTVWGFLDQYEIVPHAEMWVVFPIFAIALAPSNLIVKSRYK